MPKSEYIIHGTQAKNLIKILKVGYITNDPDKKDIVMLKHQAQPKQIFTQLVYKDIPNEKIKKPYWMSCAIILDKKILKDYPFYATIIGSFKIKFEDGKTSEDTILYGEGNLTRMPNLSKLKTKINHGFDFMHSHEILFNKKIPLDIYCKCIVLGPYITPKEEKSIIELAATIDIPVKKNSEFLGINKFIDIIES